MKLLSARLHGLYGVCRGSGKDEIFIDFTKCLHDIILITGPNGSGKSTIINVLHPFPDDLSMYMEKKPGFKELEYILNDGTIYKIRIDYPVNEQGKRLTTKAHLIKYVNNEFCDLNPNGNIGSFKSSLSEEFKLDPSFLALSLLSIEDKGLVEKTPAERKKYVGAILESTVTYNDMYKVLNKRSSIFNSMINSIVAKIDSIGDIEFINSVIKSTKDRIDTLETNKSIKIKQLASAEAVVNLSDPSGTIRENYSNLISLKASVEEQLELVKSALNKYRGTSFSSHTISVITCESEINRLDIEIKAVSKDVEYITNEINNLHTINLRDSDALNKKKGRLESITSDIIYDKLYEDIRKIKDEIYDYDRSLKLYNIPVSGISTSELTTVINTIEFIKTTITELKSTTTEQVFQYAIDAIRGTYDMYKELSNFQNKLTEYENELHKLNGYVAKAEAMIEATKVLTSRPKNCTDDSCPFVSYAIECKEQEPEVLLKALGEQIVNKEAEIKECKNNIDTCNDIIRVYNEIRNLVSYINNNSTIISKFSNIMTFTDINSFLDIISTSNMEFIGGNLTDFIDKVYILDSKAQAEQKLQELEKARILYESKADTIEGLKTEIEELTISLSKTKKDIENLVNKKILQNSKIEDMRNNLLTLNTAYERLKEKESLETQNSNIDSQLSQMEVTIGNIEKSVKDVNLINSEIIAIDNEIMPLKDKLNELNFSLNKWYEYNDELKQYTAKADMVNLLKRYTSPTKDGIQNLFIKVYMGQTLATANNLLQKMFGGELALTDYIINDKEFRIPCMSMDSPIINDDISSCSCAQKCMISMILSFVLLNQSSTIYNIPRLDEVDAGLDQENRSNFIPLVRQIMDIFKMQQCIMISHASESVLTDVDIIMLGKVNNETPKGNIIFTY